MKKIHFISIIAAFAMLFCSQTGTFAQSKTGKQLIDVYLHIQSIPEELITSNTHGNIEFKISTYAGIFNYPPIPYNGLKVYKIADNVNFTYGYYLSYNLDISLSTYKEGIGGQSISWYTGSISKEEGWNPYPGGDLHIYVTESGWNVQYHKIKPEA